METNAGDSMVNLEFNQKPFHGKTRCDSCNSLNILYSSVQRRPLPTEVATQRGDMACPTLDWISMRISVNASQFYKRHLLRVSGVSKCWWNPQSPVLLCSRPRPNPETDSERPPWIVIPSPHLTSLQPLWWSNTPLLRCYQKSETLELVPASPHLQFRMCYTKTLTSKGLRSPYWMYGLFHIFLMPTKLRRDSLYEQAAILQEALSL